MGVSRRGSKVCRSSAECDSVSRRLSPYCDKQHKHDYQADIKLCMTVYKKCLHGMGPIYLSEMCRPSSSEAGRRHLRSANRSQLVVSRQTCARAGWPAGRAGPENGTNSTGRAGPTNERAGPGWALPHNHQFVPIIVLSVVTA